MLIRTNKTAANAVNSPLAGDTVCLKLRAGSSFLLLGTDIANPFCAARHVPHRVARQAQASLRTSSVKFTGIGRFIMKRVVTVALFLCLASGAAFADWDPGDGHKMRPPFAERGFSSFLAPQELPSPISATTFPLATQAVLRPAVFRHASASFASLRRSLRADMRYKIAYSYNP